MVKRKESQGLDQFEGTVEKVEFETGIDDRRQYHIYISPEDREVQGATGLFHEWIPLSPKSTEEEIPQGSVIDRFLTQLEIVLDDAKKANTVSQAMDMLVGNKFKFKRMKLGKDYQGHEARQYWVPVAAL